MNIMQVIGKGRPPVNNKIVYLAGPIDNVTNEVSWREDAAKLLSQSGICVFDPSRPYIDPPVGPTAFSADDARTARATISMLNRCVIGYCFAMIATIDTGRPFGTIREIEDAKQKDKLVWLVTRQDVALHVESHDIIIVPTLADACKGVEVAWAQHTQELGEDAQEPE